MIGRRQQRLLATLLAVVLVGPGSTGCGGAGSASRVPNAVSTGGAPALRSLKGDEDDDDQESHSSGNFMSGDSDNDADNDYEDNVHNGYYDKDDEVVLTYGDAASAAAEQALTAVVKRYHAAAAAGDGSTACSMITSTLARSVAEAYGRAPGPAYLRGAKTCPAIMSLVFKHDHKQLAAAEVTGVRVEGGRALVLLGSRVAPARYFLVVREGGAWRISGLLGVALP